MERWADIEGFPGYRVSDKGRVISNRTGAWEFIKGTAVKGYRRVVLLNSDGVRENLAIHRLVAKAFIENPQNLQQVGHLNGDKEDNTVDNLKWVTGSDSMLNAWNTGLVKANPKKGRRENDTYYSTIPVIGWLLDNVSVEIKGTILEPAAGDGALSRPLKAKGFRVITNDIAPGCDYRIDLRDPLGWESLPPCDWIICNPPFSLIDDFLPTAFEHARRGIAVYCRKSATEPCKGRVKFLQSHRRHLSDVIYCPRQSFTGDGRTDEVSCDWHVWTKAPANGCQPFWIDKW